MNIKPKLRKICLTCGKEFFVIFSYTHAKYCSRECVKPKLKKVCKICNKEFFVIHSNVDAKYCSKSCEAKRIRCHMKSGKDNWKWKGDKVQTSALHVWIRKNKPKPEFCEICQNKPPMDVANISGEYKRDINDFRWLCRKCHQRMDKTGEKHRRKQKGGCYLCSICKVYKPKNEFWKNNRRWDKIAISCIDCLKNKVQNRKVFKECITDV